MFAYIGVLRRILFSEKILHREQMIERESFTRGYFRGSICVYPTDRHYNDYHCKRVASYKLSCSDLHVNYFSFHNTTNLSY